MRLVPAKQGMSGGLWRETKPFVENGFETTFRFQLTDQGGHGADGLTFVVQNNPTPSLGGTGHAMGFGGVANALAVKFDPYHYHNRDYAKYDEIAVLARLPSGKKMSVIGATTNLVFADGKVHTVKISYTPGTLRVFFDAFQEPLLTVPLDLATAVSLDQGHAWVGFTAATGADYFNHDLLNWTFSTPETMPESSAAPAVTSAAVSSQSQPIYASDTSANPITQLTRDPSFGYAVPAGVALTQQIEASTDLIHWAPVTNAVLFFRDPDSTNYEKRFYRFRSK